jgi:hypothetical protein
MQCIIPNKLGRVYETQLDVAGECGSEGNKTIVVHNVTLPNLARGRDVQSPPERDDEQQISNCEIG